jgi:hypothetical protein
LRKLITELNKKEMTITEFIASIDNKIYNRIRNSKGDAECRRLLKEHEQKQLYIHVVSKRFNTRSFIIGIGCGMAIGLSIALIILNVF